MTTRIELKRQWIERCVILAFLVLVASDVVYRVISRASLTLTMFIMAGLIPFLAWTTWISFTTPDISLSGSDLHIFRRRISRIPTVLSLRDIESVERNSSKMPIWRIPPLVFRLHDGTTLEYSTGGDTKKMERVINFIEKETPLRVRHY